MDNIVKFPAGRVHKRYAANIPRVPERGVSILTEGSEGTVAHPPLGIIMLGLITLWAFWCAGVR